MKIRKFHLPTRPALIAAGAVILVLAASPAFGDFSPADWQYVKPVTLPPGLSEEGLVELTPDAEVFAGSSPGLIDARIIADDGGEVPYVTEISRGDRQRTSFNAALRDKGYVPGRYTTFVADLGRDGVLHNQIEIRTPSTNFRATATVEASSDGTTWVRIAENEVYDFTVKEIPLTSRDTGVKYTDSTARYLRVQIADEGDGPLEITGAAVFFTKETRAREVTWPVSILGTGLDAERRATLVELDLGAPGLPTHRLALEFSEVNFYREVTLETSSDREEWRRLGARSAIYAYDTPKFVGSSLTLTFPETSSRYFRLAIFDEDNPALHVEGVSIWGLRRRIVFSAEAGRSYNLYYGNTAARKPSYDMERIFPYLATEDVPQARLGPQAENPGFVRETPPPPPTPPVSERLPWLFPSAVGVAAVGVAFLLFGVLRKARKMLPPPEQ